VPTGGGELEGDGGVAVGEALASAGGGALLYQRENHPVSPEDPEGAAAGSMGRLMNERRALDPRFL